MPKGVHYAHRHQKGNEHCTHPAPASSCSIRTGARTKSSGGDITIAIGHLFGSSGMRLVDEVEPLAAYGILLDGKHSSMKMVTKGGMAGNNQSIIRCVDYLLAKVEDQE